MKNIKRLLTFALCFAVIAGTMALLPAKAYATGYKYKVTVNAGKEGTLNGDNDNTVKTWEDDIEFGGHTQKAITPEALGLKVKDDSTYYIRGLKISGHDNDETDTRHYQFPVTIYNITEDMSLSVAYGVKGDMIDYVVRYVDANNTDNDLVPARTYYGTPGDYLVVSSEYMEGYQPDAYNKGWTLKEDGIREIIFYMSEVAQGGGNGDNGGNGGNGGAGNAGGGAGNAGAGNGPAQFVNLDDNQTPTTAPGGNNGGNGGNNGGNNGGGTSNIDDQDTPTSLIDRVGLMPFVLGGGLLAALIALIAFLRARGKDGDEEDADELEDIYINNPEGFNKLQNADPEQFKTDDPDELKEAFKELGKKE